MATNAVPVELSVIRLFCDVPVHVVGSGLTAAADELVAVALITAVVVVVVSESVNCVKLKRTLPPVYAAPNWSTAVTVYRRLPFAAFVAVVSGVTVIVAARSASKVVAPHVPV
jgi:hypothetical protein